jgi:hypothetical protein
MTLTNGLSSDRRFSVSPLHRFGLAAEEVRELESLEIPEKVKKEVCQEVAEKMGISVEEVRELMEKAESAIPGRKFKK